MARNPNKRRKPSAGMIDRSVKRREAAARRATKPLAGKRPAKVSANALIGEKLRVSLSVLYVAKENPRFGQAVASLDEKTASMRFHGQLQDLLCYRSGKKFAVTDGASRLAAMAAADFTEANIEVRDKAAAIEGALAANLERDDMHPADAAVAFANQVAGGKTAIEIANRFGKSERYVLQRLELATLHPPILKALRADEIDLNTACAFANAPDARQPALWKKMGKQANPHWIETDLKQGKIQGSDPLARYVGVAAYEAAGGKVDRDLFAFASSEETIEEASTWLTDREKLQELVDQRIETETAKFVEAGWGFVHFHQRKPFDAYINPGALPDNPGKRKNAMSQRGVVLTINDKGKLCVETNLIEKATAERARKKADKGKAAKGGATAAAGDKAEHSNGAHYAMTRMASRLVGRSLWKAKPELVVAVIAAQLATTRWPDLEGAELIDLAAGRNYANTEGLKTDEATAALDAEFLKRLTDPKANGPLVARIAGWVFEEQVAMLAFLTGELFKWREDRPSEPDTLGREALAALGHLAGADPVAHFPVDEDLLKGLSTLSLVEACAELSIEAPAKKSQMVEAVLIAAADKAWVPPLVRKLTGAEPADAPKGRAKKRRGRK